MDGGQRLEGEAEGSRAGLGDVCTQDLFWALKEGDKGGVGEHL